MARKFILLSLFTLILGTHLFAQFEGKIEGIVTDESGSPLEKVQVTITSLKASSIQLTLTTNAEGKFVQVGLRPGYYQVNFKKEGFFTGSLEVRVRISETSNVEVRLKKTESSIDPIFAKADNLFHEGNKLYEKQAYEESIPKYREAIQIYDKQWAYFFNLGLAYKKLGRIEESSGAFANSVALNPESYSCNKEMAEALAKLEKYEEAKPFYQKALELNQDDANTYFNYGMVLIALGESGAALTSFLKTIELQEDYADAYYQLGTSYIGQNKTDEAVKNLERFLELAPEHEKAGIARQLLEYLKK